MISCFCHLQLGGQLSALLTSENLFSLGAEWRSCDTRRNGNYAKLPPLHIERFLQHHTQPIPTDPN